jgi:hypothetical protein
MKKSILLATILGPLLISCNNNKAKVNSEIPKAPAVPVTETLGNKCYLSLVNNDTVSMQLNINVNNEVNGKLTYIPYQKDKNEGTIVGNIKGDTLIADYTFTSEGKSSIREVVFLKKDARYIEGYGTTLESNGKKVFTDKKKLKFDSKIIFNEVDCEY